MFVCLLLCYARRRMYQRNTDSNNTNQPLIPSKDNSLQHRFIEKTIAHPLRNNDINFLDTIWQCDFLNFSSQ